MGVYRFRLRNKVLDACRGLSVGLFKNPIKTLIAKKMVKSNKVVPLFASADEVEMVEFAAAA